jgi:oligosaccharide translocation protein RFT1
MNAILFRYANTELIGACNFRIALLYSTIMFLAREPFRRALPNLKETENKCTEFKNSLWLVVINCSVLSTVLVYIWINILNKPDEINVPFYNYSIYLCAVSCILECLGEPAYSIAQILLLAKIKVAIEALGLFLFNFTFVMLAIYAPELGALSYSIAKILNSLVFTVCNIYFLRRQKRKTSGQSNLESNLLDQFSDISFKFDYQYLSLVRAYYSQSLFKQLLTEGERYLITAFNMLSFSESGVYDLVNNLGSLIARFLFLPIEDGLYIFFTNSLVRGKKYKEQLANRSNKRNSTLNAKLYLELLFKALNIIGIIVFIFGQGYSKLLLKIYGGNKLSDNIVCVNMLRLYSFYIIFLAINGISEGFFNATISEEEVQRHNYKLVAFSISYLMLCFISIRWFNIYGFIIANTINMMLRIVYSCRYLKKYFKGFDYQEYEYIDDRKNYSIMKLVLPNRIFCIVSILTLVITKISEFYLNDYAHFAIGALLFIINIFVVYKKENQISNTIMNFLKVKKIN